MIVEKNTALDFPQQDGSTKRKHYESIVKQTGEALEELEVPEIDPCLLHIKYIFDSMSLTRRYENGFPTMITDSDIYYWCKLHGEKLSNWHLHTLRMLDVFQINSLVTCIKERKS